MRHLLRRAVFGLVLVSLSSLHAVADKIDDAIRAKMETRKVPGLSVAVVQNGKVVKAEGYGKANVETDLPATPQTVYQLASVTKQFTAVATLMLSEDGKLKLDDLITKFVDGLPTTWSAVTVRHLLNHTSGIKSYTELPEITDNFRKDITAKEIIKLTSAHPLDFAPGEKWHYNNTGYYLLGMIIEKASGKPYAEFLQERIFQPLKMETTRLNSLQTIIKNRAMGYTRKDGTLQNGDYVSPTQPFAAGALVSTVLDMAKWDQALAEGKLLKKESYEQMWSPTKLKDGKTQDYGFGWAIGKQNGHREIGHGGGIPGFSTYIGRYVDDKLTVIVLANSDFSNAQVFAQEIAALYVPELAQKTERAVADADPKMLALMRQLLQEIADGKLDLTRFTDDARNVMQNVQKQAQDDVRGFGKLKEIEMLSEQKEGTNKVVRFRLTFANETIHSILAMTAEGKIAGLGITPGN